MASCKFVEDEARRAPPVPISSASETEPLLPRSSPPPRYSSIGPSWEVPLHGHDQTVPTDEQSRGSPASAPLPQSSPPQQLPPFVSPGPVATTGWWTWVPGPAQMFPPGLEHLAGVDTLLIKKKGRRFWVWRGGSAVLSVRKMRDVGGAGAALFRVQNNANLDVLLLNSTWQTEGPCSSSIRHVEVSFPPGNVVGVVQGGVAEYTVHNPSGDLLFLIHGQNKTCCGRFTGYTLETREMHPLGQVARVRTPGCCVGGRVMELTFPGNLDLLCKALLLSGAIVIRDSGW